MRPLIIFLMVSLVATRLLTAQDIPSKKHADKAVQDYIGLLSVTEQELLNTKLKNYADSTSTGIAIAIRNDIDDDINFYAAKMLTEWELGQEKEDNGVLFLLDIEQRKIAISTGYGVEHLLTDNLSKRIITKLIIPEFKNGNFYTGLDKGTTAVIEILSGAYVNSLTTTSGSEDIPVFFILVFFIILIIIISNKKRRGGGRGGRRFRNDDAVRSLLEAIILSSSGRGGFGGSGGFGSGSSGGGFGGFGGGMGGGGGASGSW